MRAISTTPDTIAGAPGDLDASCDQIGRNWMKTAPAIKPTSEPSPPTTTPTRSRIERATGKMSGFTNVVAIAKSEPATPAYPALTPKARVLERGRVTPAGGG